MNIKKIFADIKIFIGRAQSYVSMLNSGMIFFLFLSKVKDAGYIHIELEKLMVVLFFITLLGMILIGFIEDKLKLHDEENKRVWDRNPHIKDIIARLERIETEIKKRR